MTTPKNFPGNKQRRRISALLRLQTREGEILVSSDRSGITRIQAEISVLEERIAKGGKKSTKKVGSNIGRRNI